VSDVLTKLRVENLRRSHFLKREFVYHRVTIRSPLLARAGTFAAAR
jgi:hypothetical protein